MMYCNAPSFVECQPIENSIDRLEFERPDNLKFIKMILKQHHVISIEYTGSNHGFDSDGKLTEIKPSILGMTKDQTEHDLIKQRDELFNFRVSYRDKITRNVHIYLCN